MRYQLQAPATAGAPRLRIRAGEDTDQFACIALDPTYTAERAWQIERLDEGEAVACRVRPVWLPRPRLVRSLRDTADFLKTWQSARPLLVAEIDGEVVGWLAGRPSEDQGALHLAECVVAPVHRRRGVGSALLAAFRKWGRDYQRRLLRGSVPTHNDPAVRWLARHGWRLCGWDERSGAGDTVCLLFAANV